MYVTKTTIISCQGCYKWMNFSIICYSYITDIAAWASALAQDWQIHSAYAASHPFPHCWQTSLIDDCTLPPLSATILPNTALYKGLLILALCSEWGIRKQGMWRPLTGRVRAICDWCITSGSFWWCQYHRANLLKILWPIVPHRKLQSVKSRALCWLWLFSSPALQWGRESGGVICLT